MLVPHMTKPLFKTKSVKIDTLAQYLKEIREQLNLDIKTVSMLTQIKPIYIEGLESGDWSKLPAEVYIRGFLKSLAQVYHIKEELLTDQFQKEYGFEPKKRRAAVSEGFNFTPKTIIAAVSLGVLLLTAGYVAAQIRSVLAPPLLEVSEPPSDAVVAGNSIVISGRAEIGSEVSINNQSVVIDKNGFFTENLILSNGLNVLEIKAVNKFSKESKVVRLVNAEFTKAAPVAVSEVNITLEIGPESAWVYMEVDGVVVQRGTMLPGSAKTVSAKQDVLLTTANAGSTKVIYNGKDLGKLGRPGEVVRNVEFSSTSLD
jgi:transcriptional regulator with XRE-family HTH domain